MWKSKYALAFYVGLILGTFGAAQQGVVEIATTYPAAARIGGAFLIGLALFVDVLPRPNQIVNPQMNVEKVENMQTTLEAPQPPPVPSPAPIPDDRPAVGKGPRPLKSHT